MPKSDQSQPHVPVDSRRGRHRNTADIDRSTSAHRFQIDSIVVDWADPDSGFRPRTGSDDASYGRIDRSDRRPPATAEQSVVLLARITAGPTGRTPLARRFAARKQSMGL